MDKPLFYPIFMHFAARYAGKTYAEFASNYKAMVEANIKTMDDFGGNAVTVMSDPYVETAAFGAEIIYPKEGVPYCKNHIINSIDDVINLKTPDLFKSERTLNRIKTLELFKKEIGNRHSIIGWVEGPLAESADLAGAENILLQTMIDPDFTNRLMDKCMATAKEFAKIQYESGCDIIGIGDALCSQISPETYEAFIFERHKELASYIKSLGAKVKLHICGNITHLLKYIKEINPNIVDIDSMVDMDDAYNILGDNIIRCGNLDPANLIEKGDPETIYNKTKSLIKNEQNRPFILSGGCEITVLTPHENIIAMNKAINEN